MKSPHILLAASNCRRMLDNLKGVLDGSACSSLESEIHRITVALFHFGEEHFTFGKSINRVHWRQKISRYYYGAYNVKRAIQLHVNGVYNEDVSDHKNIDVFPDAFPNKSTYKIQLVTLRNDRNIADYGFESQESDLVIPVLDAEALIESFVRDSKTYLSKRGVML